ncbi:hypothetical protein Trydic_g7704 [Trypoxylus dichotomus]
MFVYSGRCNRHYRGSAVGNLLLLYEEAVWYSIPSLSGSMRRDLDRERQRFVHDLTFLTWLPPTDGRQESASFFRHNTDATPGRR